MSTRKRRVSFPPSGPFLVPTWLVIAFAMVYVAGELFLWFLTRDLGLAPGDLPQRLYVHRSLVPIFCATAYGLYRAITYHPLRHAQYRRWLAVTPWTSRQPLPLGPVGLHWRDLLLLVPAALLAHFHAGLHPAIPLICFAFAYLVPLGMMLAVTNGEAAALALACGLPLLLPPWLSCWGKLAVAGALLSLAHWGLRRSLAAFPWSSTAFRNGDPPPDDIQVGALLNRIGPRPPRDPIPASFALIVSLLVGWWLYSGLHVVDLLPASEDTGEGFPWPGEFIFATVVGLSLALWRFSAYALNLAPPVSLLGRIATGRLIIPRYDRILVAPICVTVLALFAAPVLHAAGLPMHLATAASVSLTLFAGLALGPTLKEWRLTGHHRLARV